MQERTRHRTAEDSVSELTTGRLSVYLRCLDVLDSAGVKAISSNGLAERFLLNAAQIRKDLANFGEFGVRGVGYYVADLRRQLRQILGVNRNIKVVIVGAGNLGLALADYPGFGRDGFEVVALFDVSHEKVGGFSRRGVVIRHTSELARVVDEDRVEIAVIAVPAPDAQAVIDEVVATGVKAILNFAPGGVRVPARVKLKSVDVTLSLEGLSFFLAKDLHGHQK